MAEAYMVLARTTRGRASLQHKLPHPYADQTECGLDTTRWSKVYMTTVMTPITCKKCLKKV